jgi:hypothetical protein
MKRPIFIATIICLLVLITTAGLAQAQTAAPTIDRAGSADPSRDLTALVQHLSAEVQKLRIEVHQLQLELQQGKVTQVEQELQKVQADKRKIEQQEKEFSHEIAQMDERLSQPTLAPEEQAELTATRAELLSQGPARFLTRQQQITQQEAEVTRRLGQEQQRLQELVKAAKE